MKEYDCVVIGAGPGGYVAAIRAGQLGLSTACVEKSALGGTCLNTGCIPTKAMLAASDLAAEVREARERGVSAGEVSLDMGSLQAHKRKVVKTLQGGIAGLLKKNKVETVQGAARLADRHTVEVTQASGEKLTLAAKNIIVATGSKPARPSAFPFGEKVLTSDEALELEKLPGSIVIVGGGIIGAEFACFFRDAGSEVTVVEMLDRLVSVLDEDVSRELARVFKKRGIRVETGARIEKLAAGKTDVTAEIAGGKKMSAEIALVAVGRALVTRGIGLEEAGVEIDEKGAIRTDEHLRTTIPNIYAIGDANGRWQLAHAASRQGVIAAENAAGREKRWSDRAVPSCVYTRPEIGMVGLTEAQAREKHAEVLAHKYPMRALGRAIASGAPDGFVKVIAAGKHREVVGVHIVGARATELVSECALAIEMR
ncbi:MAG: dihydrolipoyl dehydrogenase, partial [Planctomycetota bacterium]